MIEIIGLVFIFIFMIFLVFAIFKYSNAEKNKINIAIDDIDYVINNKKGNTNFALLKENNKLNILKNKNIIFHQLDHYYLLVVLIIHHLKFHILNYYKFIIRIRKINVF